MNDESSSGVQVKTPAPRADQLMSAKRSIAVVVVFFLVLQIPAFFFSFTIGVYVSAQGEEAVLTALPDTMASYTVPFGMLGILLAGLVAFRMTRRTLSEPVRSGSMTSLGFRRSAPSGIALATFTGCVISLVYLFILIPASPPAEEQQWGPLATSALAGGWQRILWAILILALAPPIEEFIFRGVLLSGLSNAIGIRTAALIVTVLFILIHASETLAYWPAWVGISLLAFTTVLFRIKTESLVPAIAVHVGYNLVLVVAVYFGSA